MTTDELDGIMTLVKVRASSLSEDEYVVRCVMLWLREEIEEKFEITNSDGWRSVDKPPETTQSVIVQLANGDVLAMNYEPVHCEACQWFDITGDEYGDVILWRPLPKPRTTIASPSTNTPT